MSDPAFLNIVEKLRVFRREVKEGHAQLAAHAIESTIAMKKRTEGPVKTGPDLFGSVSIDKVPKKDGETMKVKFKQHLKSKRDTREDHYMPVCVKTNKERVPRYRFHHVEIKKNILTPNTMLTFVPHLRDLERSEEAKYNLWLKELEDFDLQSGFKPMSREEKVMQTIQSERAATLSLYLESWLDKLNIPGCNKTTLIRYMAREESDNAITPQQKNSLLRSHGEDSDGAPGADRIAQTFTDAFRHVFNDGHPGLAKLELSNVLQLEESVDSIMDSKPTAKDGNSLQNDNEYDLAENNLATYCILGCLICFSHACEHGEFDAQNCKRTFSMLTGRARLSDALKRRQPVSTNGEELNGELGEPCNRSCYLHLLGGARKDARPSKDWSESERTVLRSIFVSTDRSKVRKDPMCLAAEFLNRDCDDVYCEFQRLDIKLPEPEFPDTTRVKNLPWYDRFRKVLLGDWQEQTVSHEFELRELPEPCCHEGPCRSGICPCVDAGLLCERFCRCTVENCAWKFTGCACHSQGKLCQPKQKDRSCICIQLNRECDPELCGTCGSKERADPTNADDDALHATGCQNCDLQRGVRKSLLLGQSQLEGVGYGLFTAEDIAQDEFIVEYVGELITHDEGVRREARRGDVFDEESTVSYLFTLLENEGIWVDAAVYGNLSRYINHAPESEKRGCNISPRILYVNGEFRIKFTAMRDIKAGEELFFNYGKEFPNLTKKLLDDKAGGKSEPVKRKGRKPKSAVASEKMAASSGDKAPKRGRKQKRPVTERVEEDIAMENGDALDNSMKSRKRKRRLQDDSEEEEYHPTGTDATSRAASESSISSDKQGTSSASRLRRRAHQQRLGTTGPDGPLQRNQPKTRGKRGGARPGSGRPRKHPRPGPKPATVNATSTASSIEATSTLVPAATEAATTGQTAHAGSRETNKDSAMMTATFSSASFVPTSPALLAAARATETEREEEDDEDQDVVIRNRTDRTARNRRPPAKFRDEDVWN
ncbi:hypothetical protein B0I35DRAFT_372614 [Stachybotrys elegans]|uniref:SET domain-containing protein n=1 Tax=Stachybotrys elegans TaxID=80388 RepID=A0A8K0WTK2_9HYPO|nr:hypothetical protein B0I35DRAFT_372614 [Stachybotrys elegans]